MKKYFLLLSILLPFISLTAQAQQSWWPVAFPDPHQANHDTISNLSQQTLQSMSLPGSKPVAEQADAIRLMVNENSRHLIDDEFYSYWHDMPKLITMIKDRYTTSPLLLERPQRPNMECATRSAVMHHLLAAQGIESRIIVVYPDEDTNASHTFLEIYDPATNRWTIQDPDMNIFWTDARTGERLGVAELLATPLTKENFTPCTQSDFCGWPEEVLSSRHLYAMATRFSPDKPEIDVLLRPQGFSPERLAHFMSKKPLYCAMYEEECRLIVQKELN